MNKEVDNMEINIDDLESVNGGTSVDVETTDSRSKPHCKSCGKAVLYLGQARVNGGNTGKYKCTNKKCKKFDVTVYNDSVVWK
jgi:predicted secreted Zn-dependent protease